MSSLPKTILITTLFCLLSFSESSFAQLCRGGSKGALNFPSHDAHVKFSSKQIIINKRAYNVKVAETPQQLIVGLSNQKSLSANSGMIFYIPPSQKAIFNMESTAIPLDMLFVGKDKKIVCVAPNNMPFSKKEVSCDNQGPILAVIEIKEGEAKKNGITAGTKVEGL